MTEIIDAMPNSNGMDQQQFAQALVPQTRQGAGGDGGLAAQAARDRDRERVSPSTFHLADSP